MNQAAAPCVLTGSEEAAAPPQGVDPARWERLIAFLAALPPAAAARLFGVFERSGGAEGLPAGDLLAALRGKLIADGAAFPARPPSARRLFFAPFEDFFVSARRGRKRRGRIARASVEPIWRLLADPACERARAAAAALDAAIAARAAETDALEAALFEAAGEGFARLIAHAESDPGYCARLGERLGGPGALHDLAEFSFMMPAARHLRDAKRKFPRSALAPTEEDLFEARRLYAHAYREAPAQASYVLLLIAARMEAPWRALAYYYHLAGARDDRLPAAREDAAILVETLFDDLEGLARFIERDASGPFNASDAELRAAHFAQFAQGMIAEARRFDDSVLINRAEASRDIAASALSRFCEQSLAAIRRAQPLRHAGGSSRLAGLRPDIDAPLGRDAAEAARSAARFLARAGDLAAMLERADACAGLADEAMGEMRRYAGDLVLEIRAAEGTDRAAARRRMETALSFAAPLLSEPEIALLKERAAVASVSA